MSSWERGGERSVLPYLDHDVPDLQPVNSCIQVAEHSQVGCITNLDPHTIPREKQDEALQERRVHHREALHLGQPNERVPEASAVETYVLGSSAVEVKGLQNGAGSNQVLEVFAAYDNHYQGEPPEVGKRDVGAAGKVHGERPVGQ